MIESVAVVAALLLGALAVFQAALAFGASAAHLVYGGRVADSDNRLPGRWRAASAVGAFFLLAFAWVVLARAGVIDTSLDDTVLTILSWMVVAYLSLNTAANLMAKNPIERWLFGGLSGVLVVLCAIVAAAGPQ
ncbi:MAG: hypothetical protein ACR2N2_04685 [Acidimicrobiia bacterium]